MKYFLTGGTGFLGGVIARKLREQGHEVIAIARNPSSATGLREIGVTVTAGDVSDKQSMRGAMEGCDGVFHVAGWYKLGKRHRGQGYATNVLGTQNVLSLAEELNIPKIVYTSTLAINSDTKGAAADENYVFTGEHLTEYDRTKAEAHQIAKEFIKKGLPLVILQPGLIYGPDGTSLSDDALRDFLRGRIPMIPKKCAYCCAHVDDVADIHIKAMHMAPAGSSYIVCGPCHTFEDIVRTASELTGLKLPLAVPPVLLRISSWLASIAEIFFTLPDMYSSESLRVQAGVTYLGNNSKARKELDYQPRDLRTGLRQTLDHEMKKMGMKGLAVDGPVDQK